MFVCVCIYIYIYVCMCMYICMFMYCFFRFGLRYKLCNLKKAKIINKECK